MKMDIVKELWDRCLPNFGYVIDMDNGTMCTVVLGGQSSKKEKEILFKDAIYRINTQMQEIYSKEILSADDKIALAELMRKMYGVCDSRKEGLYTRDEQASFIDGFSKREKAQLECQINMLKDCREFYRQFIFK